MYSTEDVARFAEGDMEAGERLQFEEALRVDEGLRSALSRYYDIHSSLKMQLTEDEDDRKLRQTLSNAGNVHFKKEAKLIQMQRYLTWISAVAAVFLVLLIWAPWRNNLYEEYAGTEMIATVERSGGDDDQMAKAVKAFNKEDFSEARAALEPIYRKDPANAMVQYYYAITLVETDEAETARGVLEELYAGTSVYKYDAAFYIALSFLKEENKERARYWLQKIPEDAVNYAKSRELLNKLK